MVQIADREAPDRRSAETERSQKQKRRILQAAGRVFRRQGLHASGMRDIAAELDMHAGNLYYYFSNKAELLAFCQEDALDGLLAAADDVCSAEAPADAKLARLIVAHVERLNEATPGSLAHLEVEALDDGWRGRIQARRDDYERVYRRLIEEGISSGRFRPVDPRVAAMAILGSLNWTVKWFHAGGRKSAGEIGAEFAEILVRGLLADGAAAGLKLHTTSSD